MVPPLLYKIIKCNTNEGSYASAFLFPNSKTHDKNKDNFRKLIEFQTDIGNIELMTGLRFKFRNSVQPLSSVDPEGL